MNERETSFFSDGLPPETLGTVAEAASSGSTFGKVDRKAAQLRARVAGTAPALMLLDEQISVTLEKAGERGRNSSVIDGARNDFV